MPAESCVDLKDVRFAWPGEAELLNIPEFRISAGERLFVRGPSGSGKSSLLGLIAGVLQPQRGNVLVLGEDMARLSPTRRDALRADHLGVIFQLFNLVPYLDVLQNVALPCRFSKLRARNVTAAGGIAAETRRLLSRLGLDDDRLLHRKVTALSVGQQQRVAAARALIGKPSLVIADEPTSALDADTRDRFIELLSEEAEATGAALIFVSHDAALAPLFERSVDLTSINEAYAGKRAA